MNLLDVRNLVRAYTIYHAQQVEGRNINEGYNDPELQRICLLFQTWRPLTRVTIHFDNVVHNWSNYYFVSLTFIRGIEHITIKTTRARYYDR